MIINLIKIYLLKKKKIEKKGNAPFKKPSSFSNE